MHSYVYTAEYSSFSPSIMMDWFRLIVVFWWWRWFSPSDGWVLRKSDQGWAVTVGPLVKPCSQPPAVKDGPRSGLEGVLQLSFTSIPATG